MDFRRMEMGISAAVVGVILLAVAAMASRASVCGGYVCSQLGWVGFLMFGVPGGAVLVFGIILIVRARRELREEPNARG